MKNRTKLPELTLAATLGGIAALTIVGGLIALLSPGGATGPYMERGSGRSPIPLMATETEDEKPEKPKRQRTEIATAETDGDAQTTEKPARTPDPGNPRN